MEPAHPLSPSPRPGPLLRISQISGLTQKVLTQQLRKLEANHLVTRVVYPEIPPKVEYTLTPHGKTLIPILDLMNQWGQEHYRQYIEQTESISEKA